MDSRIAFSPALAWLLEPDHSNPAVRYFALRDLVCLSPDDPEINSARKAIMASGPVPVILEAQDAEGYWSKPGNSYSPKYQGTGWQIYFLSELGADPADDRVQRGCEYLLTHAIASNGAFSYNRPPVPSGVVHCLNGNLLAALVNLGFGSDSRVQAAISWQTRAITGEGEVAYYKSGTNGPNFSCAVNLGQPCGWGAVKALRALCAIPASKRSEEINRALQVGANFLLSRDPSKADYPYTERVSSTWYKFGFPLSYWSDVLELAEVLAALGYGHDPRLNNLRQFILSKQDSQGRWKLENSLNGKMWVDLEKKGQPSKWVTLRALRVLVQLE